LLLSGPKPPPSSSLFTLGLGLGLLLSAVNCHCVLHTKTPGYLERRKGNRGRAEKAEKGAKEDGLGEREWVIMWQELLHQLAVLLNFWCENATWVCSKDFRKICEHFSFTISV